MCENYSYQFWGMYRNIPTTSGSVSGGICGYFASSTEVARQSSEKGHDMRILITDGDKKFREQAQALLLQRGHDARAAADGLECAEILRHFVPELLVLNCDFLWGGYQGVVALIEETPRLSQTQMVLIADEEPRDVFTGSIDTLHLARVSEPFQLNDLLTLMESGSRSPRPARQIDLVTSLDCQQGGMQ